MTQPNTNVNQSSTLLDVQGLADQRGVTLNQVGVKNVEIPMQVLQKDGKTQTVQAVATMSVGLPAELKGTHMSRFVIQLSEWSENKTFGLDLKEFLIEAKQRLEAPSAFIELKFRYFMDKAAPVSGLSAPMAYECTFKGTLNEQDQYRFILSLMVPCATLCPCSKAISDYGAHNQRAEIRADILLDSQTEHPMVWIEDVIAGFEDASSCPVYPLIKRIDEKFITEKAYDNPKFVEDVIRESTLFLRDLKGVSGFNLSVDALESIHAHNAWATHAENYFPEITHA
ncbi:GTP cyclohydrolase FolE2 [Vampirovibrio sp.]|uniref:GTP cyclohydrolase FolE2 n=1 Tax=Vampirovibrio sp. TaxID=2717857 RepID=UPI003593CDA5